MTQQPELITRKHAMKLSTTLFHDESGFIVSAELVLVATVLVLGMLVGMSQVQNAVVSELNDVGHAIGSANQSYYFTGFHARKWGGYTKSRTFGSAFFDLADACDYAGCQISCDGAYPEGAWGTGIGYSSGGAYSTSGAACGTVSSGTISGAASCGATSCGVLMAP